MEYVVRVAGNRQPGEAAELEGGSSCQIGGYIGIAREFDVGNDGGLAGKG